MHNHAQIRMDVPMDKLAGDFKDSNLVTARTLKTFINGDACSYTGQWLDDEPSGWGKLERDDFIYEGFFSGGAMQTYGRFVYLDQGKEVKTYYGLHQNGKFEFFGKLDDEKITFTGSFLDGEMRTGELFYKDNGQKYVGSFLNNLPQGNGKLTFKNGSFFEGGFHHGKFHDKGIFKSISNECLEGSWVYGIKTGFFNRNRLNGVICKEKYDHDEFQFVQEFSNVGLIDKTPVKIHGEGQFNEQGSGKGTLNISIIEPEGIIIGINKDYKFSNFTFVGDVKGFNIFSKGYFIMGSVLFKMQKLTFKQNTLDFEFKEIEKLVGKEKVKDFKLQIENTHVGTRVNQLEIVFLNGSKITLYTTKQDNFLENPIKRNFFFGKFELLFRSKNKKQAQAFKKLTFFTQTEQNLFKLFTSLENRFDPS